MSCALNETEEEFDTRLEAYGGAAMNNKLPRNSYLVPYTALDYTICYRADCTYRVLFIF